MSLSLALVIIISLSLIIMVSYGVYLAHTKHQNWLVATILLCALCAGLGLGLGLFSRFDASSGEALFLLASAGAFLASLTATFSPPRGFFAYAKTAGWSTSTSAARRSKH